MYKRMLTVAALLVVLILLALAPAGAATAHANDNNVTRVDGVIRGAPYSLFRPDDWNGDLVLLVHGSIPDVFELLAQDLTAEGFGVAFSTLPPTVGEGAALKEVTINTRIVQALFTKHFGKPDRTYLYGFSRGAHNMTRLVETTPARYDGVFTVCGGNGGSQLQWDYFFTARVLFDYYFPGVLPGDVLNTPEIDQERFFAEVAPVIAEAIVANPSAAEEMAAVDQYDLQYHDFDELVSGIVQSLWPHTVGVNDLLLAARGNPFDNTQTLYTGTTDDEALNAGVARLSAEPQARNYLRVWYEPDGSIAGTPVLALHTTRDPVVPERPNNDKYEALVQSTGNADFFVRRRVERFGHCTFGGPELLGHFLDLVTWAETGVRPSS